MELNIGKLTFQKVDYTQLKYQNQYIIGIETIHRCYLAGRFLEKVNYKIDYIETCGARFFIRDIYGLKRGLRTFDQYHSYYELVSKKHLIQQNMEARALLNIIRKVTGDPTFNL